MISGLVRGVTSSMEMVMPARAGGPAGSDGVEAHPTIRELSLGVAGDDARSPSSDLSTNLVDEQVVRQRARLKSRRPGWSDGDDRLLVRSQSRPRPELGRYWR